MRSVGVKIKTAAEYECEAEVDRAAIVQLQHDIAIQWKIIRVLSAIIGCVIGRFLAR